MNHVRSTEARGNAVEQHENKQHGSKYLGTTLPQRNREKDLLAEQGKQLSAISGRRASHVESVDVERTN